VETPVKPLEEDDIPKNADGTPMFGLYNGIPILLAMPDSMTESRSYDIEAGSVPTEPHIHELMAHMWEDQSAHFYYYHAINDGPSVDSPMLAAKQVGMIDMSHRERRYYKHPNPGFGFVRIIEAPLDPSGQEKHPEDLAWEKEVVDKGPEYWRVTLKLMPRKIHEFDTISKVQLEEKLRKDAERARYDFDVFLSYASPNVEQAEDIHRKMTDIGLRVFMAKKSLEGGDDFADEIRKALVGSREIFLLLSPSSMSSEWVTTEWGAAWVLSKRISPILFQCATSSLPDRLRKLHCTDLHNIDGLIASVAAKHKNPTAAN
jgi:hypothetical protein